MNGKDAAALPYYRPLNEFFRYLSVLHMQKLKLPGSSFCYGPWKRQIHTFDNVILFDRNYNWNIIKYIHKKNPGCRIIVWYWNPLAQSVRVPGRYRKYCEEWSFNIADCKQYGLNYNVQFTFWDSIKTWNSKMEYDAYFVGRDKGRRDVYKRQILMCAGFCLLYSLMRMLFSGIDKERAVLISGIAVLYPPWIFYMQMTMTEALLLFLYILICWLLIRFLENPRALTAVFLVLALVYIYFVHMRSIGLIAAGGITLFIWAFGSKNIGRRRKILLVLGVLVCLFLLGLRMKNVLIGLLYHTASSEVLSYNDYSGQWDKLRYLFSIQGWKIFLAGCAGKALYLGLATYGLGYGGIFFAVKKAAGSIKSIQNRQADSRSYFWIFLTLASLAQFFVTVIYTVGSAERGNERLDLFLPVSYTHLDVYKRQIFTCQACARKLCFTWLTCSRRLYFLPV